jgi:hypothetical protein
MQRVADHSAQVFARRFIGRTMSVLWESVATRLPAGEEDGAAVSDLAFWSGYTDNYIRVAAPCEGDLQNRITSVELLQMDGDEVKGRLTELYPVSLV